ncbi:MAG TPA: polysaccharide deacetylase family protein [Candidatus Acidoferrales bacterium]|nr:polysaccharide deacetylase family protein [Candidatus Acidoferrales bacterium]
MKIDVVLNVDERITKKIKYGFTLLFQPLRVEVIFSDEVKDNSITILYGKESPSSQNKIFHLRASHEFEECIEHSRLPDISHLEWLEFERKRLPKLFPVSGAAIDFDIAAAAFMLASEFQDLISLERDEFDRLRAMDSLQDKLGILDYPAVNYYSIFLKEKLEKFFDTGIELKKYADADHGIALTHDVDYTSSLNLRMIKRNIFGHAILNKENLTPNERAVKFLRPLLAMTGYDPPKNGLKFLRETELRSGLKSTFFIKTGATAREDMNYHYRSRSLRNFMRSLMNHGFDIGIHPSMRTYIEGEQLILEKTRLENLVGKEINSVRQHYLKFTAGKTVGIWENARLKYDSTLGFSRKAGFRNSIAFPFPLYDFQKDRISTVTELPLMIMDGTFSANRSQPVNETYDKMKKLVDETKAAHGAASILFHNSLADPIDFPGYKRIYSRLLSEAENDRFRMDSLSGIIEQFR